MKFGILLVISLGLTTFLSVANSSPPTCEEEPTRRDCIKVEDPNATPPKQTVNKKDKQLKPKPKPRPVKQAR